MAQDNSSTEVVEAPRWQGDSALPPTGGEQALARWWPGTLATWLLLALPLLWVELPPSTDLPQQVAQIDLLAEAIGGESPYRVQWWHPNKLGYLPLLVGRILGGPLRGGGLALALIAGLWVLAIHALARIRGRGRASAALACLFFFSPSLHWGFVNFLLGLPIFLLAWSHLAPGEGPAAPSRATGPRLAVMGLLLYSAHVLWLALATFCCLLSGAFERRWVELARRLAWLSPAWALVALWYVGFRSSGVDQRVFWAQAPWQRLHPTWLVESLLGGLRGSAEGLIVAAVLLWLLLGLWQHRHRRGWGIDRALAVPAAVLVGAAFLLPAVYHHTILFAARWLAPAAVLAVLAAPQPRLPRWLRLAVPASLLALLAGLTCLTWSRYQADELAGFRDALYELEAAGASSSQTLLGLDFVRTSPRLDGFPYHHLPAYAQALTGVGLGRSFADDAASLVVYRQLPHDYPWTDRLDWKPERLRTSDLDHFDYLLAHADDELHARFAADPRLEAIGSPGRWRLYRIRRPADRVGR